MAPTPERRAEALMLFVRFPPVWAHIDPLRQYVDVWVRGKMRNGAADRAGMIVQELLENAVKYGDPTTEIEFEIHTSDAPVFMEIRVTNRAHPSRVAILEREFQRTHTDSAREAFARALNRLQRLPEGTTMLGLARIAMESALSLDVSGDRVSVTARVADHGSGPQRKH